MKFSLLKKSDEPDIDCEIIYDLSIDRAVEAILNDKKRSEYFLSVLSHPLSKRENIIYRQEIFRDLSSIPGLLEDLQLLFTRYDRIKSDWQDMKLGTVPSAGTAVNPEALLEHTYASLKVTSIFPNTIVSYFHSLRDTLSRYPIKSEGLTSIRSWCAEMSENKSLDEIVNISRLFRYQSPEYYNFSVNGKVDESLRLIACELYDIEAFKPETDNMFRRLFIKKKADNGIIDITTGDDTQDEGCAYDAISMLNEALSQIDSALTQVTNSVYEAFFGLGREIMFYEASISIQKRAEERKIPICMPEILPDTDDTYSATELRELLLLSGGLGGDEIVPNDLTLGNGTAGILVKGMNDTGKTVFLRAVGGAQLFAQAGLFVLAKTAKMSIRHGFFSHFSSAEEEFMAGDAAGRFDQEAKEVAHIINRLVPYSFVLLNETFQTTSYGEGTEGIYNVLRVLPLLNTKYVFVTHLTRLFDRMSGEKVVLAQTSDKKKYKIVTNT